MSSKQLPVTGVANEGSIPSVMTILIEVQQVDELTKEEKRKLYIKEYQKKWYAKDKERLISTHAKNKHDRKQLILPFIHRYKLRFGCKVCGYKKCVGALDFHHRDPKTKLTTVATLIIHGASLIKIKTEIRKCDILCANCHRELHYNDKLAYPSKLRT